MVHVIKSDKDFQHYGTLSVHMDERWGGDSSDPASQEIEIYENNDPGDFFIQQMHKIRR